MNSEEVAALVGLIATSVSVVIAVVSAIRESPWRLHNEAKVERFLLYSRDAPGARLRSMYAREAEDTLWHMQALARIRDQRSAGLAFTIVATNGVIYLVSYLPWLVGVVPFWLLVAVFVAFLASLANVAHAASCMQLDILNRALFVFVQDRAPVIRLEEWSLSSCIRRPSHLSLGRTPTIVEILSEAALVQSEAGSFTIPHFEDYSVAREYSDLFEVESINQALRRMNSDGRLRSSTT